MTSIDDFRTLQVWWVIADRKALERFQYSSMLRVEAHYELLMEALQSRGRDEAPKSY